MLRRLLAVTLLLLTTLPAWATTDASDRLHAMRSHGFLLVANVLVYFNYHDSASTFSPEVREAYRAHLAGLGRLAGEAPATPGLVEAVQGLQEALAQLEKQPEDAAGQYARWINPLLRAHGELEKAAAAAYGGTGAGDSPAGRLQQQSLDLGRLLLLYETQAFTNLGIFAVDFHEDSFREIDQRVAARHAALLEELPDAGATLGKVWTDYNFIRPHLLDSGKGVASRSAVRYLGKGIEHLDQLALARR